MRLSFLLTLHVLNYTFMVTRLVWQNYGPSKLLAVNNQPEQIIVFQGGMVGWHGHDNFHPQIPDRWMLYIPCMNPYIDLQLYDVLHVSCMYIHTYTIAGSYRQSVKTKLVREGEGISDRQEF